MQIVDNALIRDAVSTLATVLRQVAESSQGAQYLENCEENARRWASDRQWLWQAIVRSFSTMGNSSPWMCVEKRLHLLDFDYLASIPNGSERARYLQQVLSGTGIRYMPKKINWLTYAVEKILQLGGIEAASHAARAISSAPEKILYMQQFKGIGPKYGRNIWMDLFDRIVSEHIAVDSRIESIISIVTPIQGWSYGMKERFILKVAAEAGLSPWETDRLLYGLSKMVERLLRNGSQERGLSIVSGAIVPQYPNHRGCACLPGAR